MMRTTTMMQRNPRPVRREAATHLFAVGQAVRLKGGFGTFPKTVEIYRITAPLPPRGDSLQYRIRSDGDFMNGWRRRTVSNRSPHRRVTP